jgi:transcriptional regulator with XRE-family HTH domain
MLGIVGLMMSANATASIGYLREQRRAQGLSQQALAERAGCSVSYVRLLEAGYSPDVSAVLDRITAALTDEERQAGSPDALQISAGQGRHATG